MARHDIEELAALRIALRSTLQTLASPIEAASSLSSSDDPTSAGSSSPSITRPSLAHLHSALLALAHTLKKHASQLALALGKPPATIPAALPSLVELGESWKRLVWVVDQVDRDDDDDGVDADIGEEEEEEGERRQRRGETNSALGREWRWWTDAVGLALAGLVRSFEDDRSLFPERSGEEAPPSPPAATGSRSGSGSSSSNSKGRPAPSPPAYLAKMGVLFGLLDSATRSPPVSSTTTTSGSSGLSRTADEAGLKRWTADGEGLVDGEREAREMAEEATAEEEKLNASSDGDDDDDKENGEEDEEATEGSEAESEDDWARLLGEAAGQKPTAAERELITATLPLLRLVRSLHSNVPSLLLPVAASAVDGSTRRTGSSSLPSSSTVPSPSPPPPPPMTDRTSLSAPSSSTTTTKPPSRTDGGGGGGNRRSVLDPLLGRSASLLASADELVASLYGPIDGAELADAVEGLVRAGRDLAAELDRRTKPPSPSMTTTTTDNDATSSSSSDVPDPRAAATTSSSSSQSSTPARDRCGRWLALWRLQLDRVRSELVDGRLRLLLEQQQQQQPTTGGQAGADELAGKLAQTRV